MQNQKQYAALRGQMLLTAMGLGRKLALAQNEQEDARLWLAYHEALEALRQAENAHGQTERSDMSQWDSIYYNKRPVFDARYVSMTKRLIELYRQRKNTDSIAEHRSLTRKIENLTKTRRSQAKFVPRDMRGSQKCE